MKTEWCPVCGEELLDTDETGLVHRSDGLTVAECEADHLAYVRERAAWAEEIERRYDADYQEKERERAESAG